MPRFCRLRWTPACLSLVLMFGSAFLLAAQENQEKGPRLGRYKVTFRTSYLTYFDLLPAGKYKVYHVSNDKLHGEGEYTFDDKEQKVRWLSGPHQEVGYGGTFKVEDGGRKHVIRMSSSSIAANEKK